MPSYDYFCPSNNQTIEVKHGMSELLNNWGELCEKADINPGDTALDSPIERKISGGFLSTSGNASEPISGGCGSSCGCH